MSSHWIEDYIGDAWRASDHDCWGFFRRVQRERFGVDLPAVDPGSYSPRNLIKTVADHPVRRPWHTVETPAEGDGVLMGQNKRPTHVGVWVAANGGGVLHCQEAQGVVLTNLQALTRMGWHVLGIYRYTGATE